MEPTSIYHEKVVQSSLQSYSEMYSLCEDPKSESRSMANAFIQCLQFLFFSVIICPV